MAFRLKFVCVVAWSLSGAKNGQEIGKMLSIVRSDARQVNKDCAESLIKY